jgi:hypothetical protein
MSVFLLLAVTVWSFVLPVQELPPDWTSKFSLEGRKRLVALFAEARPCAGASSIRFVQREPSELFYTSRMSFHGNEILIEVKNNLDPEIEENAVAHELFHIVLSGCEGFSNRIRIPDNLIGTTRETLADLGATITSCFDDPVIDSRMKGRGFSPELLNHVTVEALAQEPVVAMRAALASSEEYRKANALSVYCWLLRLSRQSDKDENMRLWKGLSPEVVRLSEELRDKIGNAECTGASTCFELKKRTRDAMGYYQTKFYNPSTSRNE